MGVLYVFFLYVTSGNIKLIDHFYSCPLKVDLIYKDVMNRSKFEKKRIRHTHLFSSLQLQTTPNKS